MNNPNDFRPAGENGADLSPKNDFSADKRAFSIAGFGVLAAFVLDLGINLLLAALGPKYFPDLYYNEYFYWAAYIVTLYIIAFPVGIWIIRRVPDFGAVAPERERTPAARFFLFLMVSFPLIYAGNAVGTLINSILLGATGKMSAVDLTAMLDMGPTWLSGIMMVIVAPVMEELFFRRVLLGALRPWGEKAAILMSGIAFGLFHGNLQQFCYAALLGLLLGYVACKTGKLIYPILLHVFINLFSGFLPSIYLTRMLDLERLEEIMENAVASTDVGAIYGELMGFFAEYLPGVLLLATHSLLNIGLTIAGAVLFFLYLRRVRLEKGTRTLEKGSIGDTVFLAPGVILFIFSAIAGMIWVVVR